MKTGARQVERGQRRPEWLRLLHRPLKLLSFLGGFWLLGTVLILAWAKGEAHGGISPSEVAEGPLMLFNAAYGLIALIILIAAAQGWALEAKLSRRSQRWKSGR